MAQRGREGDEMEILTSMEKMKTLFPRQWFGDVRGSFGGVDCQF
jgi:hypothetical protein